MPINIHRNTHCEPSNHDVRLLFHMHTLNLHDTFLTLLISHETTWDVVLCFMVFLTGIQVSYLNNITVAVKVRFAL